MYKLLIVDDDEIVCRGLGRCIPWTQMGIKVVGLVYDGEMALEYVERERPDLVIVDINMPFMDGMEFSTVVRQKYPDMKTILLTAYQEFAYAQKAVQLQVFEYLTKPFTNEEVMAAVKRALRAIEEEREYRGRIRKNPDVFLDSEVRFRTEGFQGELPKLRKQVQECVRQRDFSRMKEEMGKLFERIRKIRPEDGVAVRFLLVELMRAAWEATEDDQVYGEFLQKSSGLLAQIMDTRSSSQLEETAGRHFQYVYEYLESYNTTDIEKRVNQAVKYIRQCYSDPELNLNEVASQVSLSASYLGNSLKKYKNTSYVNLLNQVRIENAKKLLARPSIRTCEVAFLVGFNSSQYFSSCFKKNTGMTPGAFRKQVLSNKKG